jgi:hypothetical protein
MTIARYAAPALRLPALTATSLLLCWLSALAASGAGPLPGAGQATDRNRGQAEAAAKAQDSSAPNSPAEPRPVLAGPVGGQRGGPLGQPCSDQTLLDQPYDGVSRGRVAQDFTDLPEFSAYEFDDFVVPQFECWFLSTVICRGVETGDPNFNLGVSAAIWDGLPGQGRVVMQSMQGFQEGQDLVLFFDRAQGLPPGRYWLSVWVQRPFFEGQGGQWFWLSTQPVRDSEAWFWNPGGGFGFGSEPLPGSVVFGESADLAFTICGETQCWGCSVEIVGCAPICVDDTIVLNAVGWCPGGWCEWSVSPPDKVEIVSVDNCTITLQGINPSDVCDDVVVEVTYHAPDGSVCQDTCTLTVVDVEEIDGPDLMCLGDTVTLSTKGKPDGGECEWSVEYAGEGRVSLAPNKCSVNVTGTAASEPKEDITIKVKYKVCGKECQEEKKITVAKLECTNIKFDHAAPDTGTADGLNIRKSFKDDLTHKGNGVGKGEWVKGSNNEQALYVADKTVTCKVRFTIKPKQLTSARVKATKGGDLFGNIKEQDVAFANGVSNPEFVEMSFDAATPKLIAKMTGSYEWTATQIEGKPVGCKFDTSGPHTLYNVLDVPRSPWFDEEKQHPWVSALDFVIEKAGTKGKGTVAEATVEVTKFVHSGYGLKYDTTSGAPKYGKSAGTITYQFTAFMNKSNGVVVNCYDCAGAVSIMGALVGGKTTYLYLGPFGYILQLELIGRGDCTNPFWGTFKCPVKDNPPNCKEAACPCVTDCVRTDGRNRFGNHAFVELDAKIFDGCAGPALGTDDDGGYLGKVVDLSSVKEREKMSGKDPGDKANIDRTSKLKLK